jgi:hypothetical protein
MAVKSNNYGYKILSIPHYITSVSNNKVGKQKKKLQKELLKTQKHCQNNIIIKLFFTIQFIFIFLIS